MTQKRRTKEREILEAEDEDLRVDEQFGYRRDRWQSLFYNTDGE